MAGGKETTRQKMINIMYLVLLAMLALNVSDTILNAFKSLNDSLDTSKTNVSSSLNSLFDSFENTKLKNEPGKARPLWEKANKAKAIGEDLNNYVENLKKEFVKEGQGYSEETGDLVERANLDISSTVMINRKEGEKLKSKINSTREQLLALLNPEQRSGLTFSLEAKDPAKSVEGKKKWEEINFGEGIPLTAAMTALTKIQADVKNAESDVVKRIFGEMDKAVVNLDKFSAVAVAPTSYLIVGQPYTAEVFLTAYDSRSNPAITVNGSSLTVKDGKGTYSVSTVKEGMFSWKGTVRVRQTDGTFKTYETPEQKYQVARPSAVVSPDAMNVFYVGVPNPVSVSAPGIPKESLSVNISAGDIKGSSGKYSVNVTSPGSKVSVIVSANIGGKVQQIGSSEFRVKRIPDPIAKWAGKTGGAMAAAAIRSQSKLFAVLENFDFAASFNVTRFTMLVIPTRGDVVKETTSGNTLNPKMQAALAKVTPGFRVIFDDIVAVGPDGSQRLLNGVILNAN
ncbi:gliding motility protein GldM [Hufsiella ginkgonis]|uniref:Gliding motility protein GldM n=1 Tax=Hufsiella ginkgonis TaxID=2695274 RepID=A0A7K1Y2S1_9SPHI|nr:gliding motility protein GldM [Hufsiella ginkgonis]MXV17583.1 gliding motility protein GldM [Hufsiella ginkgonis]